MSRTVTIALAQHDSVMGDKEANLAKVEQMMRRAAEQGADLVVFPELGTTGYSQDMLGDALHTLAEPAVGPSAARIGALAQQLGQYVVLPIIESSSMPGVVYNSVVQGRINEIGVVPRRGRISCRRTCTISLPVLLVGCSSSTPDSRSVHWMWRGRPVCGTRRPTRFLCSRESTRCFSGSCYRVVRSSWVRL